MRRVSKKLAVAHRIYRRERTLFLIANPTCQRCEAARSTEVHHKAGRVGSLLLDDSLWMAVCSPCHSHITAHPAEAYEHGWSVRRIGEAS